MGLGIRGALRGDATGDPNTVASADMPSAKALQKPSETIDPPRAEATHSRPSKAIEHPSLLAGFSRVAAGALLCFTVGASLPALGAPLDNGVPAAESTAVARLPPAANGVLELDELTHELERRREHGEISGTEFANARATLYAALVEHVPGVTLVRDAHGHVDVDALVRGETVSSLPDARNADEIARDRAARVFARLSDDLERRMRVSARDMADPATRFLEGAPGYKEIPPAEVENLVVKALRSVPLGQLPGGTELARLVERVPNGEGLDAIHKSADEIAAALGSNERAWFETKIRPIVEGHEIAVGLGTFAAITGLRAASPGAARVIDGFNPSITVLHGRTADERFEGRAALTYRDRHVFPDLDVTGGARFVDGPNSYRFVVGGTIAPEAHAVVTGTSTVGVHRRAGAISLDASETLLLSDPTRFETRLSASGVDPSTDLFASTNLTATFGKGVALGNAPGRIMWEVDISRPIRVDGGKGEVALYSAYSVDTDGAKPDARLGFVVRLRF